MEAKRKYYLEIADNAFILSHRLAECCSRGPFLEEDLASTNVSLDLIGLAESVYNEVARQGANGNTGDDLAYRRAEHEYYNCLLVEQENTDFAYIMTRQFFMDAFHYYFFTELTGSTDSFLQAVAGKSLKEVTYHLKRSSEWMLRFGGGTEESKNRAQSAINELWKYTGELFMPSEADTCMRAAGVSANLDKVKVRWEQKIAEIFYLAELARPQSDFQMSGGKSGVHTERLGYMLNDIQYLPAKYPEAQW